MKVSFGKGKRFVVGALAAATIAAAAPAMAAESFVSIATGGTSGTYYPIGGAIAQAVTKGSDLQATAETGNASVANINLIANGDIEVAFAQNDTAYWAYNGQMMFANPIKNLRAVASLYPEHVQLISTKDSGIKTVADLKGKKVGVGAPGSGVEADVRAIFESFGMKYADMSAEFLDFGATTARFKDNQIDAGFVVAGYPTASIMDLATTKDVTLVTFDDESLKKLNESFPYFVPSEIPAGTYNGIDSVTRTPAVMAVLVTNADIDDEVIYQFTKAMFENIADVQMSHAKGREITLESALDGLTVPLHPGAARYYKEKGLKVD